MIGIACDNVGNLYGVDIVHDSLFSIDTGGTTPGKAHLIGSLTDTSGNPINLNYAQDIAYDKTNNELYLAATLVNEEAHLYTCDISSGVCTWIGAFPSGTKIGGFAIAYCAQQPDLIIYDKSSGTVVQIGDNIYEPPNWPAVTQIGKWFITWGGILHWYIGKIELQNDGTVPLTGHTISATYLPGSPWSFRILFYRTAASPWSIMSIPAAGSSTTNVLTVAPAASTILYVLVVTFGTGVQIGIDVASGSCVDSVIFAP